ncbi:hypothetical protein HF521_015435 [Silurus meridionalis]|uniref:Uncharacterized protein n=1 Tax=Silurus meridionalis TaxID=175797 RepID=A0A8T0A5G0_SILME|nr:hypothetical protein HF521_015435 [Silurus meridionalis]
MKTCFVLLFLFLSQIFRYVGGSSGQELIRAVGESVTFNTSVPVSGNIIYKGDTVGQVFNNVSDTNLREKFVNRLQWVSLTGLFTLSDLRTDDSGLYTVESVKDPKKKQEYQLEVYERVSAPQVMKTTPSSSEFCSVLCSVRNSRGLMLSLYEDDVLLNHTSSSNITLNLLLEIKKSDNLRSKTFSCVSSNPVSNERTRINLTHHCSLNTDVLPDVEAPVMSTVLMPLVCAVMSVMTVVVIAVSRKYESRCFTEDRKIHEILSVTTTVWYEPTMFSSDLSDDLLIFSDN